MEAMEPGISNSLAGSLLPCDFIQSVAERVSTLYMPMWLLALAAIKPVPLELNARAVNGAASCIAPAETLKHSLSVLGSVVDVTHDLLAEHGRVAIMFQRIHSWYPSDIHNSCR